MTTLIQECDLVENTILFLALTPEQQAEVRALATEAEKRVRVQELLDEVQ